MGWGWGQRQRELDSKRERMRVQSIKTAHCLSMHAGGTDAWGAGARGVRHGGAAGWNGCSGAEAEHSGGGAPGRSALAELALGRGVADLTCCLLRLAEAE